MKAVYFKMYDVLLESNKKEMYSFECNYQKTSETGDTRGSIQEARKIETEHVSSNKKK